MHLPEPLILDPHSVPRLRWGVMGPGAIAETWVGAVQKHTQQQVTCVASRTAGRAREFAHTYSLDHVSADYDELVSRDDIDALYIASYPSDHFEHAMLGLRAGKHVLVEKPLTLRSDQAAELLSYARSQGLLAMEAMWTRYLPQSTILRALLESGDLGQPELFAAQFCTDNRAVERLWTPGGGGILFDMGIYTLAMAQQILGNPSTISSSGIVGAHGIEQELSVSLIYESGARAHLLISGIATLPQVASCSFEKAQVSLHAPFFVPSAITIGTKDFYPDETTWKDTTGIQGHEGLAYQATWFADYVAQGLVESPVHPHEDVVATLRVMEEILESLSTA